LLQNEKEGKYKGRGRETSYLGVGAGAAKKKQRVAPSEKRPAKPRRNIKGKRKYRAVF
jgi:hypothetical protein